jgi:nitroreductase
MMSYDDLKQLCEYRRSVRDFADKPVDTQTLLKLLEVARLAPNIENIQPWHFHLIVNKSLKAQMTECVCYGNFIMGAGAFIVVSCDKSIYSTNRQIIWNPREIDYSCVAAMSFMMLAATSMGLGSCFVSLDHGKPHELLKLPASHIVIGGMMIGHLKESEKEAKDGHKRKPLQETYTIYE